MPQTVNGIGTWYWGKTNIQTRRGECEHRAPGEVEGREFFHGEHARIAPKREDIATWFDLLDLDDYVSFGGKA